MSIQGKRAQNWRQLGDVSFDGLLCRLACLGGGGDGLFQLGKRFGKRGLLRAVFLQLCVRFQRGSPQLVDPFGTGVDGFEGLLMVLNDGRQIVALGNGELLAFLSDGGFESCGGVCIFRVSGLLGLPRNASSTSAPRC